MSSLKSISKSNHPCSICQKGFPNRKALRNHTGVTSLNFASPQLCVLCNQQFCSANALEQHQKSPSHDSMFQCKTCKIPFRSIQTLHHHQKAKRHVDDAAATGAYKKRKQKPCHQAKLRQDFNAISDFFSRYPSFAYDSNRGVAEEFYRMCDFFAWDRDADERLEARQAFKDAMVIRFNSLYGTDTSDIGNWHKLCVAVNIEPLPRTIAKCKEVCASLTHVTLVPICSQ